MANRISFDDIPYFFEKNSIITTTIREVFKNLRENYQIFQKVADQDLLALSSIFGETFEKALEIVDENKITYYHTSSDTAGIYQIEGSSNQIYTIFPSVNYCPCPSYKYQVAGGNQIICKHVLATVIADVTNKKESIEVTNEHLNDLLLMSVSLKISKMNNQEEWNNRNPYMEQFMCPNPGISPLFGIPPVNWVHIPPQTMPWSLPPESHPPVVRFTAGDFGSHPSSIKRKCDNAVDVPPTKMLVTEEKMAAHMRNLHISEVEPSDVSNMNYKDETMETERLPKLVVSNEIKNLKTESVIPESILKKLEKPEMALVLWQPPATDLGSKLKELRKLSKDRTKEIYCENSQPDNSTKLNANREKECKREGEMDVPMEAETENNNLDSIFRPIDPVPMRNMQQNQYFQPVPQFHGYSPFS